MTQNCTMSESSTCCSQEINGESTDSKMGFLDLAKKRYSAKNYDSKAVEDVKLMKILEAGRVAPTAANMQPQRFLVIKSKDGLGKLSKGVNFYNAPLAIIVCGDHSNVWIRPFDKKNMIDIDTSISTDHMMMMATELGLGTCWLEYFDPKVIRNEFNIPENLEPVSILAIGYANGKVSSPERHTSARRSMQEFISYESF